MNVEEHIIFEDRDLLVIDKPAGLQVERDRLGHPSLEEFVLQYLEKYHKNPYLGIVHRLDRPVFGVIVLAKKLNTLKVLQQQMLENEWDKIYKGIVTGEMPEEMGKIENYLLKDPKQKKAIIYDEEVPNSKKAILRYGVIEKRDNNTLLEIQLITGRYHQIRAQLGNMGCPIIGDTLYGSQIARDNGIQLQAYSLSFHHPKTDEPLTFTSNYKLEF